MGCSFQHRSFLIVEISATLGSGAKARVMALFFNALYHLDNLWDSQAVIGVCGKLGYGQHDKGTYGLPQFYYVIRL